MDLMLSLFKSSHLGMSEAVQQQETKRRRRRKEIESSESEAKGGSNSSVNDFLWVTGRQERNEGLLQSCSQFSYTEMETTSSPFSLSFLNEWMNQPFEQEIQQSHLSVESSIEWVSFSCLPLPFRPFILDWTTFSPMKLLVQLPHHQQQRKSVRSRSKFYAKIK